MTKDSGGSSHNCRVCSLLSEKGPNGTREGAKVAKDENVVDLVFLSHPAYPSSLFSLWWPSAGGAGGWKAAWWMQLVGPPLSLLIPILWPWLRNGECMEVAEDIEYSGIRMQNWVLSNFGYQYVLWPFRRLVEAPCHISRMASLNFCIWKTLYQQEVDNFPLYIHIYIYTHTHIYTLNK